MFESSLLSWTDLFVVPIILFLLHSFLGYIKNYFPKSLQVYFFPAWYIRVLGTFLNISQFEFYYGQGDMFTYYTCAKQILNILITRPIDGLNLILSSTSESAASSLLNLPYQDYLASEIFFIGKIGSILGLFTLGSYIGISIFISLFSFLGCWYLLLTFYKIYPYSYRLLAYSILFVPSVWFWGTTLMKDPISLGAIGFLTYYVYMTFKEKVYTSKNILLIMLYSYIILNTKSYIFLCFLPFAAFWCFSHLSINIGRFRLTKSLLLFIVTPVAILLLYLLLVFVVPLINDRFTLDNILNTSEYIREYIKEATEIDNGLGYDLGEINISFWGLIRLIPSAINVSLFRPYLWEIRKIVNIPSALESFITSLITLWVIVKSLNKGTLWTSLRSIDVIFCLGFSLTFAFFIGISTFNFGALVRYKIPILPFYFSGLVIIYQSAFPPNKHLS